jgi:hypothetical protein
LEARALAGLKQYEAAVDMVADDDSAEAKRLRADIYWAAGNWATAATKTEDILGQRWNVSGPRRRRSAATSCGRHSRTRWRATICAAAPASTYAEKMEASGRQVVGVVTEQIDQRGVEFRDLAKASPPWTRCKPSWRSSNEPAKTATN